MRKLTLKRVVLLLLDLLYPHGRTDAVPRHSFKFFRFF